MEIRRTYDRLISTIGFPILIRWHLYIESGPSLWFTHTISAYPKIVPSLTYPHNHEYGAVSHGWKRSNVRWTQGRFYLYDCMIWIYHVLNNDSNTSAIFLLRWLWFYGIAFPFVRDTGEQSMNLTFLLICFPCGSQNNSSLVALPPLWATFVICINSKWRPKDMTKNQFHINHTNDA